MVSVLWAAVCAGFVPSTEPACIGSYLYQPVFCEDFVLRGPARPYSPQPGDLMFSADGSLFWLIGHNLAGTSHPTHSGVVFKRRDGSIAILEAGPHDTLFLRTLDAIPHLKSYEDEGRVWLRRRAVPLTEEESARLTEFAEIQDGKRFALMRLCVQLSPFRPRGPLRTRFLGKPHGPDQRKYYCSELVMEALVYAGLTDAETARPAATYPRDIFLEKSLNPYLNRHL